MIKKKKRIKNLFTAYRKLSRVALGTRMWCMLKNKNKQSTNGHALSLP